MNLFRSLPFIVATACAISVPSDASGVTIYRETFGRALAPFPFTVDITTRTAGWAGFQYSGSIMAAPFAALNNDVLSRPSDVANVNAGANPGGGTAALPAGYAFLGTLLPALCFTTEFAFNPAEHQNLTFSWYEMNSAAGVNMNLAVRIGDQWHVNKTAHTSPGIQDRSNFSTQAQLKQQIYDPAAANWSALSFNGFYNSATDQFSNSTLALNASPQAGDLFGPISAFGLLISTGPNGGLARFDTFQIDGQLVPEPSAVALIATGFLVVVRHRAISSPSKG
jgi:hypothetical protein